MESSTARLEESIRLYKGDFMEGFTVADSSACEEWMLLCRERYKRLMMEILRRLVEEYDRQGQYEHALELAWRQLELEPRCEESLPAVDPAPCPQRTSERSPGSICQVPSRGGMPKTRLVL